MTRKAPANTTTTLLAWLVMLAWLGAPAHAKHPAAVGDGEHLWLIEETAGTDDKPQITIYHAAVSGGGKLVKLDPLPGELKMRGLAAGDGRLLIVMDQGPIVTLEPKWSDLRLGWAYRKRSLPAMPEGCSIVSLATGPRGPWALVRVYDQELVQQLDNLPTTSEGLSKKQKLNRVLGLPEDFKWHGDTEQSQPAEDAQPTEEFEVQDAEAEAAQDDEQRPEANEGTEADEATLATPSNPAYRLIHLHSGRWVSSPMPEGFHAKRRAGVVIRSDEDRPTVLIEQDPAQTDQRGLLRYSPINASDASDGKPDPGSDWLVTRYPASGGSMNAWYVVPVDEQLVLVTLERRLTDALLFNAQLLRGEQAIQVGTLAVPPGKQSEPAVMPWRDAVGVVVQPAAKKPDEEGAGTTTGEAIAGFAALDLDGETLGEDLAPPLLTVADDASPAQPRDDLYVQIAAFVVAMGTMLVFYRRATRPEQLDLPDDVVLAGFGRRALSGFVDLAPGFWIAGSVYDTTLNETLFYYWPGNGVPKVFAAMLPGFVVIGVTLVHTAVLELITARSLGKWVTGLYVADLAGKPAGPMPVLVRALSRAFDLFAPLMLVVAFISPARQRLGDILAKTIVVMPKPKPMFEQEDDQGR